jgi:hypothetical protein
VMNPPNEKPTPLGPEACAGRFRFDYSRKSRDALTGLIAGQPDLRARLGKMLVSADYQVAELGCDNGQNTYVLLGDRDLIAIYRDGDIANIERLQRLAPRRAGTVVLLAIGRCRARRNSLQADGDEVARRHPHLQAGPGSACAEDSVAWLDRESG